MKKIIMNVLLLNILAAPCLLTFNDINPITGEWDWRLNLIGIVYSVWFNRQFIEPIFKPLFKEEEKE